MFLWRPFSISRSFLIFVHSIYTTFVSVNVKMKVCKDQLLNKSLIINIHVLNSSYAGHPPWL